MKVFILCGGFGTRLDYEGQLKAKPMVRIGKNPILIHLIESFYQDVRFNDKKLNLEQKFSYLDILKITSLRLYHFINPYKFYYSPIINLWNIIYFGLLYAVGIYYFVISKNAIKKIRNKKIYWENEPLNTLIKQKKLFAFKHDGFWKSLDTLKDKNDFNEMYKKKKKPWMKLAT